MADDLAEGVSSRGTWATRAGFILAAVGSAVGLGNVWRFPFVVGESGGAAFLVVYLAFVVVVGLGAMLAEFVIGRHTHRNPVGALRQFGGDRWRGVGLLFIFTGIVLLSFYAVAAGWALRYTIASLTGAYLDSPGAYFESISMGWEAVGFQFVFLVITVVIVALGIQRGIELAVQVMVPAIIVLIAGLAIYAATLPGATTGYSFYLDPDFSVIRTEWQSILPAAAGQAFFTLSLGMGVMITYASYLSEDRNLAEDGVVIVGLDTAIAFAVGLVVFPILAVAAVDPADPGPGAIFVSLSQAFGEVTFGWLIGFVFFFVLSLAALSSAISLLEVVVSYLVDEWGIDRAPGTALLGGLIFVVGMPTALNTEVLVLYDELAANVLLLLGGIVIVVLVSWVRVDRSINELGEGITDLGQWGRIWLWLLRVPVLFVLVVSLVLALFGFYEELEAFFFNN